MSFISKIWQNKDKEYNINIQITSAMNVNFVTEMVKKVPRFNKILIKYSRKFCSFFSRERSMQIMIKANRTATSKKKKT